MHNVALHVGEPEVAPAVTATSLGLSDSRRINDSRIFVHDWVLGSQIRGAIEAANADNDMIQAAHGWFEMTLLRRLCAASIQPLHDLPCGTVSCTDRTRHEAGLYRARFT